MQIFQMVAEEGSFTKAANRLHMAQPAVSIAVRKLEEDVGLPLFSRADKKVNLTSEGGILLQHARTILMQFEQAKLEMSELQAMEGGRVNLGTSVLMGSYYFPDKIAAFRQQYPQISVSVIGEGTRRAQQLLLDGEIDMALVNVNDAADELEVKPLGAPEEIVACVARSHPLASQQRISFTDFLAEPLVVYREGYYMRELIEAKAAALDLMPNIAVETNVSHLMINLIEQQQGLGFCIRRVADQEPGLSAISFEEPMFLELGFAWKRNRYVSKANQAFMDFVLSS
ncbi:LysR family transcriptional regulator [Maricurvus nonylphenolicus]|uniref:LysR family transcriptional regulator n=1 Tax=Maricurvus nonylphenolicus TaxID=1008307 RepID=UPI0036F35BEC